MSHRGVMAAALCLCAVIPSAYAWRLKDAADHVVQGPGAVVKRFVTLSPGLAEVVFAAGAGDKLMGTVSRSDYPPAAAQVPRIGSAGGISLEALVARRPDLVLAWGGGTAPALIGRLRELGIPVAVLRTRRLSDIADELKLVGRLAGTSARADAAAQRYRRRLHALRRRYGARSTVRVFYQISMQPLFTVNATQSIGQVIRLCGGHNVFADIPAPAPRVSVEAVLAANPQAILYPDTGRVKAVQAFWSRFANLAAVRRHALYALPANTLERASPRVIDGAAAVCRALDRARQVAR